MNKIVVLTLALLVAAPAFGQIGQGARTQSAAPKVEWQPVIESTSVDVDEVFPAEILALAGRHVQQKAPVPTKNSIHIEIVAFIESRPVAFPLFRF